MPANGPYEAWDALVRKNAPGVDADVEVRAFTKTDYSPTYYYTVDAAGEFLELVRVASLPPEFDDGASQPITAEHVAFLRDELRIRG